MDKEIYTGTEQWQFANGGHCEYCRRAPHCRRTGRNANHVGCRPWRTRLRKEATKARIEAALESGLTPEQINLTPEMIEYFDVKVPEPSVIEVKDDDNEVQES